MNEVFVSVENILNVRALIGKIGGEKSRQYAEFPILLQRNTDDPDLYEVEPEFQAQAALVYRVAVIGDTQVWAYIK